ncbi:unnamed protein product [Rodentolepis nana]|uniref:Transmembrane protein n=1 Tax=Rodentolepis nana TaxID=102285 RepID=A0A0R3T4C7_RODNA|nr:unnamed protein product [Rodentolepis nana]
MSTQQIQSAPISPKGSKFSIKLPVSPSESKVLPPIVEDSPSEIRSSIRFDLPRTSSSFSTLTSLSESTKNNAKNFNVAHPCADLSFLRNIHKRTKRKRRLRKLCHILYCIVVYGLPIGGLILGIAGIILGHFLHIEPVFVGSCVLLISAVGVILQSCFWKRSLPNKFRATEVPFITPQEDSLISKSNEQSEQENDNEKASTICHSDTPKPTSINSAQVRRLSLALTRATAELSAARQISSVGGTGSGVLNLARRLTMAPVQYGDFGELRGYKSGNGWVAGHFPHGVRRSLAWNDTGASRFYASNYN